MARLSPSARDSVGKDEDEEDDLVVLVPFRGWLKYSERWPLEVTGDDDGCFCEWFSSGEDAHDDLLVVLVLRDELSG